MNPSKQSPAPFSDHKLSSEQLAQALQQTMLVDRYSLQRAWREMSGQQDVSAKVMQQWLQKLQKSQQRFLQRQQQLPQPIYPEELPVSARKDEIAQAIRQHQVVIVCGETGSGKTTQLPKI
ncbi:MAG: hypothetical protein ACKOW7_00265, partial [Methylophilaceae bacterium]